MSKWGREGRVKRESEFTRERGVWVQNGGGMKEQAGTKCSATPTNASGQRKMNSTHKAWPIEV